MADLAGRGPIGQKQPKPPKKPRKPLPPVSAKKRALKALEKAQGAWEHMQEVKGLPCLVCGCYGVEVHHEGRPRSDWNVLPLCPEHHKREFGPGSFHYSPRTFYAAHGDSALLLARVAGMLRK